MSLRSLSPALIETIIHSIIRLAEAEEGERTDFGSLVGDALEFCVQVLRAAHTGDCSALVPYAPADAVFRPGCASVSFNGGKDSIVTLFLVLAAERVLRGRGVPVADTPLWRVVMEPELSPVNSYAEQLAALLGRPLHTVCGDPDPPGIPFASSNFCRLIAQAVRQLGSQLVFMGYRSSDSGYGPKTLVAPSPPSDCVRVLPLLYWSFTDVFELIFRAQIPLPRPYLDGFASCGPASRTERHQALCSSSGVQSPTHADELRARGVDCPELCAQLFASQDWLPAWFLPLGECERSGR